MNRAPRRAMRRVVVLVMLGSVSRLPQSSIAEGGGGDTGAVYRDDTRAVSACVSYRGGSGWRATIIQVEEEARASA